MDWDCIIVGGGPAGLTAATYLARYRRKVVVIDADDSRAAQIPESHNHPGFSGIAGPDLLKRMREQAKRYGADLRGGKVTALRKTKAALSRQTDKEEIDSGARSDRDRHHRSHRGQCPASTTRWPKP